MKIRKKNPPISDTVRRPIAPQAPTAPDPLTRIAVQLTRIADALETLARTEKP